jgi:Mrp family chromosome partitioning ATPase
VDARLARAFQDEMLILHGAIEAALPDVERRVLHFTASTGGEGTSTIVRAYATAVADVLGRSVLIVDANDWNPDQHRAFGVSEPRGWDEVVVRGEPVERAIYGTSHPNLSMTPCSRPHALVGALDARATASAFAALRERFELVIVDCSPISRPGTLAAASRADGVVLVVEADRTRWPVAASARLAVERSGGSLLGVVLNKRRYHIPEAVYRLL